MNGARILIQVETPGPLPDAAVALLHQAGATSVAPSHAELQGLHVAIVPATTNLTGLLGRLKALPGVRHAEAETWRRSF